jgi:molybdenum cofactor cytidylyltransferase
MIVEGQIHRGLTDGVGMALMELIAFDEAGNCLGGSLMDYLIPTAVEVPDWETDYTVTPSPHHPIGAKGRRVRDRGIAADDRQRDRRCAPPVRSHTRGHAVHALASLGSNARTGHAATMTAAPVTGLVLAAGGTQRLGAPKQLLPYGSATLLDHVLGVARACRFDQLLCVVGGDSEQVRCTVDFGGVEVVENRAFGEGCSSSIAAALSAVDARSEVLVLMLCDQPGVRPCAVSRLLAGRRHAPLAACLYGDGRGHPLAFARSMFAVLAELHGDKGVWKLLDAHADEVADVPVDGSIPRDVDTWEDYQAVLESAGVV